VRKEQPGTTLTAADLVVLSLLTERPMHGYELNRELERREVQDWAEVSRPQVYYSLKKLADHGFIAQVGTPGGDASLGPERSTFQSTATGRRALGNALARPDWAVQRPPPPFLTWLALSTRADKSVVREQVKRRREFLETQLKKEKETLKAIKADTGEMVQIAALMVTLTLRQFEAELSWLREVERELDL
jgi:DNA-binding PadR family transcriptional regulator